MIRWESLAYLQSKNVVNVLHSCTYIWWERHLHIENWHDCREHGFKCYLDSKTLHQPVIALLFAVGHHTLDVGPGMRSQKGWWDPVVRTWVDVFTKGQICMFVGNPWSYELWTLLVGTIFKPKGLRPLQLGCHGFLCEPSTLFLAASLVGLDERSFDLALEHVLQHVLIM